MSRVRIYDLAKELKLEHKKIFEAARRMGIDVCLPSNTLDDAIAVKICEMYGGSEDHLRTARNDLARSYRQLILKLFPLNTDLVVVVAKSSAARALDYKLIAEHYLFSDSMATSHQEELDKIAEWIESNREDLEMVGISEVGLSSGRGGIYLGKSSFGRNKG